MLDSAACAQNITDDYLLFASLDINGEPSGKEPEGDFPTDFAKAYNDYAKQGLVLGATNTGGDESILESLLQGISSAPVTVSQLAAALAAFWATVAITPGIPSHGGTAVVSVSNDAASKIGVFTAAIMASINSTESKPYFAAFISNIEAAVKTITWTVTEIIPGPPPAPVPFPEVIA